MGTLDNTSQHLDAPAQTADNTQAANLSHEANSLHTPMAGGNSAGAGAGKDSFSQQDLSTIHQGFDDTASLYGGGPGASKGGAGDVGATAGGGNGESAISASPAHFNQSGGHQETGGHNAVEYGASGGYQDAGGHNQVEYGASGGNGAFSAGDKSVKYNAPQYSAGDNNFSAAPSDKGGVQSLDSGAGSPEAGGQSAGPTYQMSDGSSLALGADNKAQLTDAQGNAKDYNYYSNNDNGWHTLYQDSQNPRQVADSIKHFRLDPAAEAAGGKMPMQDTQFSSMHSSKLSEADHKFFDENVPEGSKPLGTGINRQAWQTPDNKAVVVGRNDPRSDAPFVLQPESTTISPDGSKKAETFPMAGSDNITKADVDKFVKDWGEKGWEMRDNKISNFGRTADGKMWRVDSDEIIDWNEINQTLK
jgi:hypothetical protein